MLTVVAILLAVFVLPAPWNVIAVVAGVSVDVLETAALWWWSRRRKAAVGVETLVGRCGVVVSTVSPSSGQVKLDGELWEARASIELPVGADVVVRSVDRLLLDVAPAERS